MYDVNVVKIGLWIKNLFLLFLRHHYNHEPFLMSEASKFTNTILETIVIGLKNRK